MKEIKLGSWEFKFQYDMMSARVNCMLFRRNWDGTIDYFQKDGAFYHAKSGEKAPEFSFELEEDHVQAFMDGLWEAGVRPKDRRYENEMTLLQDHLADFKRLVFEKRIKG